MSSAKTPKERGIAIVVTCIILVLAIPMCGLAIDTTLLYVIKCRLQGAVDGAALAAAQGLARGTSDQAQITAAQNAAATYVMLNYPASYFFTTSITCSPTTDVSIDETVAHQRTVTVNAHAVVPTLFMHWFNINSNTVNASAQTIRRDVNVAMVVDRSGSLAVTNSCQPLIQSAINFVNKFSNGRDYIGLVTFASSTNVDFPIATDFQTASPNVVTMIGNITCAGSTSSAMGLWEGYDQLVGLNQSAALNVVLFFTDGKPTGVDVNMPLAGSSPCSSAHAGSPRWINGLYNTYTNVNEYFGVLNPVNNGTITNGDFNVTPDSGSGAGCNFSQSWSSNVTNTSDFLGVPTIDVFGDNLNDGYQAVTLSGGYISLADANSAAAMAMNAADDAGSQIRAGNSVCANAPPPTSGCTSILSNAGSLSNVIIYSIGLGNAPYPLSPDLLERISNDPRASTYNSNQPTGAYIAAPTSADIDAAFALVASEILRLSK